MSRSGYDVFISYRRDGGDTLAQLIYDRLTERGYRVFLDIESLRSGKFNEKLLEVISQCRDLVVILPPGALERCGGGRLAVSGTIPCPWGREEYRAGNDERFCMAGGYAGRPGRIKAF